MSQLLPGGARGPPGPRRTPRTVSSSPAAARFATTFRPPSWGRFGTCLFSGQVPNLPQDGVLGPGPELAEPPGRPPAVDRVLALQLLEQGRHAALDPAEDDPGAEADVRVGRGQRRPQGRHRRLADGGQLLDGRLADAEAV